MRILQGIH